MIDKYILNAKTKRARIEPDLMKWAEWMETADRTVSKTTIDNILVSTIFLGLDHNFQGAGRPPILYETMVFVDGKDDNDISELQQRWLTWGQAKRGHEDIVEMIKKLQVSKNKI